MRRFSGLGLHDLYIEASGLQIARRGGSRSLNANSDGAERVDALEGPRTACDGCVAIEIKRLVSMRALDAHVWR